MPNSRMYFFKNGVCQGVAFEPLNAGTYFPAISLYRQSCVRINFGPNFVFPPRNPMDFRKAVRPMCDRAEELHVEQALSDVMYFVEHEDKIREEVGVSVGDNQSDVASSLL